MKKIYLILSCLILSISGTAQVVDYYVPVGDLIGMTVQTGDMCFDPAEYKQSSAGNTWGFQWTSTGGNIPSTIEIDFISVSEEAAGPYPATLNGSSVGTVNPSFSSCGIVGQLFSIDPTNYNFGGVNTFLMDYSASSWTNQLYPVTGFYAHISVDYTPAGCTDPDVPTVTASSMSVCPGSSVTLTITGNLNDATDWQIYSGSCGGTSEGSTATSSFVVSPSATTTYYVRGEGGCVSPGSCGSIMITAEDNTNPTASNPMDINVECLGDVPAPDPLVVTDEADNCTASPIVAFVSDVSDGNTCPEIITRTYSVTDDAGNSINVTQSITVNDITNPSASNPATINVQCIGDVPAPDILVVTDEADNCSVTPVVAHVSDISDGLTCPETITRTYSVTDDCGNQILLTQTIIVNDDTNPVPGTITDTTGTCSVTPNTPMATDNCSAVVMITPDVSFPITTVGTTTVTWTFTDDCGNMTTATQDVTIIVPDVSVTQNGVELSSNATGVSYQWIDCGTMSPVTGETNQNFTPSTDGDYAVIVSNGGCEDTSACYSVTGIGYEEFNNDISIRVIPNPNNGQFNLQILGEVQVDLIQVYDVQGRLILNSPVNSSSEFIPVDLGNLESGLYILKISTEKGLIEQRVLIE